MAVTKEMRQAVLRAHGHQCFYCGKGDADTVDHIIPVVMRGPDGLENLIAACGFCNSAKGGRHLPPDELGRAQRRAKEIGYRMLLDLGAYMRMHEIPAEKPERKLKVLITINLHDDDVSAISAWASANGGLKLAPAIRELARRGLEK